MSALIKLDAVDAWGAPSVLRAPHSSGAVFFASSTGTSRVEKRNIDRAEACFITNDSSYVHEQAHWINDIRGRKEKDKVLKIKIVLFLFTQGIVNRTFTLDHPSNLTNLDSRLHSAMDKFGMFAVTCTQATLDAFIEIVHKENEVARERAEEDSDYRRDLKIRTVSETAEYEVVVLQPKHFLPNKSCLTRYATQNGLVETPKLYQVDSNGVLREAPATADSPRYPPFRFAGNRERGGKLNPYLVILAAEIKFKRYRAAPNAPQLDAEYEALITKTIELANLLYWEPITGANAQRFFYEPSEEMDVDDDETSESHATPDPEMGFRANDAGGSTARSLNGEGGTRRPNFNWRSLLSGHDLPLDSDDRNLLREMGLSKGRSQLERVDAWRETIAD